MFTSLYSVLLPLVAGKETGTLNIHHQGGGEARIILVSGKINMIQTLDSEGSDAAKIIAMWVNFTSDFFPDAADKSPDKVTISTTKFLAFFEKVDKRIAKINQVITKGSDRYRLLPKRLNSEIEFEAPQLEIAMMLNGKQTVTEIIMSSTQPELQTLSHIAAFSSRGFIELVKDDNPLPEKERAEFFNELSEILADLLGPAAGIIIDDALDTIESDGKKLYKSTIPDLINAVLHHLDPEDKDAFNNWATEQLEKYTKN